MSDINFFCQCENITSVARDMHSTCMQCGGVDAYKKSPLRNNELPKDKTPEILWPAIRQYRKQSEDKYVCAFDPDITTSIVVSMIGQIEKLTQENAALQAKLDEESAYNYELQFQNNLFESRIAELENPWISVDDRLPKVGDEVLIRIPVSNYFNIENGTYKGSGQFIGAWCDNRGKGCAYKVTHWQPLPPTPEVKSHE